jgi:hypothetical protein
LVKAPTFRRKYRATGAATRLRVTGHRWRSYTAADRGRIFRKVTGGQIPGGEPRNRHGSNLPVPGRGREGLESARLVCRDRSILSGDGGSVTGRPLPWLEARARLGCQTAGELGAPAISSIPEQLPGHEPASARKGYEDERTLQCRDRCFDRSFGRSNPTRWASFLRHQRRSRLG